MLKVICFYFLYFLSYSILGWIMEVIVAFYSEHKFVNRGFLIGPYCSIYGWGCILLVILLESSKDDVLGLCLKAIVICSILEYATSYIMEKLFHARWWDYSNQKFNLNGRICLETMVPFGILACIVIYGIQPVLVQSYTQIPNFILYILTFFLFGIYLIDNLLSFKLVYRISSKLNILELKDNTEEISNLVIEKLKKGSYFHRRLAKAFPHFKIVLHRVEKKVTALGEKMVKK